ncbi:MAG: hypothetical protein GY862_02800 [Gammaproteobacteria bacterium]|nr:hypothetical protein [Gammaproteobacteria bacterium]
MSEKLPPAGLKISVRLYVDRFDPTGNPTGYQRAGNTVAFNVEPQAERQELESTDIETFGVVLESFTIAKPTKMSFGVNQIDQALMMAAALMGKDSILDVPAGVVSDEPAVLKHDVFVRRSGIMRPCDTKTS